MPIFEYICQKCGKKFEELVASNHSEEIFCPDCGSHKTEKQFSVIGAISTNNNSVQNSCNTNCPGASSCASSHEGCCGCGF
ncbi:MAG: zinc ribbon domain-containing protein [Fibrobacter sp.]|nr:zinc ribbon domain-containing protein [Fibrobacter sp.]